jgi:hypothetical protein
MASASTGAKYVSRLQAAIAKLGSNGTKIPNGVPPEDIKGNEEVSLWHDKHKAICEYLVASTIKSTAEAREKKAKKLIEAHFGLTDSGRIPGSNLAYPFDNVTLNVKITNPRMTLDRSKLFTSLSKQGLKPEVITKIISESETESLPPRTLSVSTTAE